MYKEIYKCRLCGGVCVSMDSLSENQVNNYLDRNGCRMDTIYHDCHNGNFGVADFSGYVKEGAVLINDIWKVGY